MLNILWPVFIIISFVYGILNGKAYDINQSIFNSANEAVQLCISLLRYHVPLEWNNADSNSN